MDSPPTYSYRNSIRPWDIVCQTVCLVASTLVIAMRTYTKFFLKRSAGVEDYLCLVSWAGLIGYAVIAFEADKVGSGIHQWEVAPEDQMKYAQLANASQIMYCMLIFITKLSILMLYLRVFCPHRNGWMFYAVHSLLWLNAAFYLAQLIVEIAACIPREKIWNPEVPGHCVNVDGLILATALFNTFSDFSLLILPIYSVWRLHMRRPQKLGVSAIFGAGLFACFASVMRLAVSIEKNHTKDVTHDWFPEFLWTSAEVCAGIVAGGLPSVPSFIRHFGRKALTIAGSGNNGTSKSSQYTNQPWSPNPNRRSAWKGANVETLARSEYRELDEVQIWQGEHDPRNTSSKINAGESPSNFSGRDETSLAGSAVSQAGILKTVDVNVEAKLP